MREQQTCWPPLVIIVRDGLEGYPAPRGTIPPSDELRAKRARAGRISASVRARADEWGEVA